VLFGESALKNPLIDPTEVSLLNSQKARIVMLLERLKRGALRKVGLADRSFLSARDFILHFPEEDNRTLRLPRQADFDRSVNLFDQREVLHRSLIAHAIKGRIIDASKNIIDAGAANGDCALVWAQLIDGTVYAIDPSANNLRFIEAVAGLNGLRNIKAINSGLGEIAGWLYPLYNVDHTPFAETPLTPLSEKNKVACNSLDGLRAAGTISSLGFIHLDVEGMELSVIRGAQQVLREDMPVLTFEAHLSIDPTEETFGILRKLDYRIFMINEVTPGGRPDCVNFMALPNDANLVASLEYLSSITPNTPFYKATIGGNLIKID